MVDWATMVVAEGDPAEVADAARRASLQVSRAGRHVGQEAIQLHGGIAMTRSTPSATSPPTSPRSTTCSATAGTTCAQLAGARDDVRRARPARLIGAPCPRHSHTATVETSAPGQVTRTRVRVASMLVYAGAAGGLDQAARHPQRRGPGVRLALARHDRLEHRGPAALPPAVPARLVAADASGWSSTSTAAVSPTSSACRCTTRCRSGSTSGSVRRHPADRVAPGAPVRRPVRASEPTRAGTTWCSRRSTPSHFLTGLTIAAVLWVRNRSEWVLWMRRYLAINFGALVVYIVYPMAPPWMASEEGFIERRPAPDHRPGLGRHRARPVRPGAPGRRQPGRRDALAARRHRVPGRHVRHLAASHPAALAAGALPARDVARARLLRRALRHRHPRRRSSLAALVD